VNIISPIDATGAKWEWFVIEITENAKYQQKIH